MINIPYIKKFPLKKKKWLKLVKTRYKFYNLHNINIISNTSLKKKQNWKSNILNNIFSSLYNNSVKKNYFSMENFWIQLYQQQYMSLLLKLPVSFKYINSQTIIKKSLLAYMMHSVKLVNWKKYYIIHSNEIIEVLFISLWIKNLTLFMKWMRKYFEKMNLKKHRKLFLLLNFLLGKLVWNYNMFLNLKGLRISLRGKFGKAGSVRKTRKYIKKGKCSYTSKNIALTSQTNVIRTLTGVFSIRMEVFFKKWCLLLVYFMSALIY